MAIILSEEELAIPPDLYLGTMLSRRREPALAADSRRAGY